MLSPMLVLTLLLGCDDSTGTGTPEPEDTDAACPLGMSPATSAELQFNDIQVDGIAAFVLYDGTTSSPSGQPPACINAGGTEVQYVLSTDGVYQGLLSVVTPTVDTFDLSEGGASVRIQLTGDVVEEPIDQSKWEQASDLAVDSVGATMSWQISNGLTTGNQDGSVVYMEAYGTASPPL